ncbi:hypothetical protein ET445_10690 [Agromyces protaetiae]|uniref:Uncharacterized protein n=1 Tax=Agromyces protaetiae TaxID=2509455 RepID=A0A4P6FFA0_9MICO|nr:hypothetical protein [Agromyces protaetiae]QAY73743.1 hypothetical protein ET445_10690 [Agromyces protaetiae]
MAAGDERGIRSTVKPTLNALADLARPTSRGTRIVGIVAVSVLVLAGSALAVTAVVVADHDRRVALERAALAEAAANEAAAEAAAVLAESREHGAEVNAGFDGFTRSLAGAVDADAAAAFERARVALAEALVDGGADDVSRAIGALDDALAALAASAGPHAETLLAASPLADQTSKDALTTILADLGRAEDVKASLARVKSAVDAVVAAQSVGQAAADAAAAEAARQSSGDSGGSAGPWEPSGQPWGLSIIPAPGAGIGPAVTGMWPIEPLQDCGEYPAGQTIHFGIGWQAREGNAVEISYAFSDSPSPMTSGFTVLASGLPSTGTAWVPQVCPVGPGVMPNMTVKISASIPGQVWNAYYFSG